MTALSTAAQRLARAGCHVFPVKARAKVPLTEHGVDAATRDLERIAAWWQRWPAANVGVACGPSGLLVVDLDGADGLESWQELRAEHPDTPRTLTARTGGAGWHLYFLAPADHRLGNTAGKIAPKIDTRGAGGYVLAPPSMHPSGTAYSWCDRQPAELAELPGWLVNLLDPPPAPARPRPTLCRPAAGDRYAAAALAREIEELRACPVGRRNDSLCRASFNLGQLVAAGRLDPRAVLAELLTAAQGIGLGDREAERTAISGLRAGASHPRAAA